jgi:hypothetical protein
MEARAAMDGHAPQHMRETEHANRVRAARVELKRRVAAGELHAAEVVLACPWVARSMPVAELLVCQPWWGWKRCRTFLGSVGLDEAKILGGLTERQRVALAVLLSRKMSAQHRRSLDGPSQ